MFIWRNGFAQFDLNHFTIFWSHNKVVFKWSGGGGGGEIGIGKRDRRPKDDVWSVENINLLLSILPMATPAAPAEINHLKA